MRQRSKLHWSNVVCHPWAIVVYNVEPTLDQCRNAIWDVMVELYLSKKFFQAILFFNFSLSHYMLYLPFPGDFYNFSSLCLEIISFVVYLYSKIFHFLYYFNIAKVFRLFSYSKYHHTTLFGIYFKPYSLFILVIISKLSFTSFSE